MGAAPDKLLLLWAARGGVRPEEIGSLARAEAARLGGGERETAAFLRLDDDPFARGGPPMRAFDATLELRSRAADPTADLVDAVRGMGERIRDRVWVDLSAAVVGTDHRILPIEADEPVRYQYLMRRRRDLDHGAYADHYLNVHAGFGRRTPGILGYTQFHVDPEASRRAAASAGLGLWDADSVSELHLESAAGFVKAVSTWKEGADAMADEENFVDRRNSVMFCSRRIAP